MGKEKRTPGDEGATPSDTTDGTPASDEKEEAAQPVVVDAPPVRSRNGGSRNPFTPRKIKDYVN